MKKCKKCFQSVAYSSAEFLQFFLKHLLPLSVLTCWTRSLIAIPMFLWQWEFHPRSHKSENSFFQWNSKWNTRRSSSFLMRVNCKKFLCSECGSDYISVSQNKHGAKRKGYGEGGKPVNGPPSGNLTRSTVCLCKPWKSQGSDPSLVVLFLIKTNEALSAVADKYLMKRDRNRCWKTVVNKEKEQKSKCYNSILCKKKITLQISVKCLILLKSFYKWED